MVWEVIEIIIMMTHLLRLNFLPSFHGAYDADRWLLSRNLIHTVLLRYKVTQTTCEFKDFAIIWWTELGKSGLQPNTWDLLKVAMRNKFVPPFKLDLCKKLHCLE
jgi:hypothetical protein